MTPIRAEIGGSIGLAARFSGIGGVPFILSLKARCECRHDKKITTQASSESASS